VIKLIAMISRGAMASITIRNLDETVKQQLRLRAAQRNRTIDSSDANSSRQQGKKG
jgi:hypothetical protein